MPSCVVTHLGASFVIACLNSDSESDQNLYDMIAKSMILIFKIINSRFYLL
jgi:hypothetical protein